MFARKLRILRLDLDGVTHPCPIAWIDNFAMRNFTNDAVFDDTLPVGDGLLEVGFRIPEEALTEAMQDWFRRKSYLKPGETLVVERYEAIALISADLNNSQTERRNLP